MAPSSAAAGPSTAWSPIVNVLDMSMGLLRACHAYTGRERKRERERELISGSPTVQRIFLDHVA